MPRAREMLTLSRFPAAESGPLLLSSTPGGRGKAAGSVQRTEAFQANLAVRQEPFLVGSAQLCEKGGVRPRETGVDRLPQVGKG